MLKDKKIVCVIPARLGSTRLPRKMLAPLARKPLLQRTYEAASSVSCFDRVVLAVDCEELAEVGRKIGAEVHMTSSACESGTDRLVELQKRNEFEADIWINWQGDEPFITENVIGDLLQSIDQGGDIWTLKKKIQDVREIADPSVVKVICNSKGEALYFSRLPVPYNGNLFFKHVGLYAFTDKALAQIGGYAPCDLERCEKLEQLRFLYHGQAIQIHETQHQIFGIDTKEDLAIAEEICYDDFHS